MIAIMKYKLFFSLLGIFCVAGLWIVPAKADDIIDVGEKAVPVTYTDEGYFTVTIPKKIVIDNQTKEGNFTVSVDGDIYNDKYILVSPDLTVTMKDDSGVKSDVNCDIVQKHVAFMEPSNGYIKESVGTVCGYDLSAGTWTGQFNFDISVQWRTGENLPYGLLDMDGNVILSWNKICSPPVDSDGTVLANGSLIDVGHDGYLYVNDTSDLRNTYFTNMCDGLDYRSNYILHLKNCNLPVNGISDCITLLFDNGIKEVDYRTDGFPRIKGLIVPDSVVDFQSSVNLSGLQYVSVSNNVTKFETSNNHNTMFNIKSLQEIKLPNKLESIGDACFVSAHIGYIDIPESVETIGQSVFNNTALVALPDLSNVKSIGVGCFQCCDNLRSVFVDSDMLCTNGMFQNSGIQDLTIGDNVTTINNGAFSGNKRLTDATIGENVVLISNSAFAGDVNLTNLTVHSPVVKIDGQAFAGCSNLSTIDAKYFDYSDLSAFSGCGLNVYMNLQNNVPFPVRIYKFTPDLQSVFMQYFMTHDYVELDMPQIGKTLSDIGGADWNTSSDSLNLGNIKTVKLTADGVSLNWACFQNSKNLKKIILPDNVRDIQPWFIGGVGVTDIEYKGVNYNLSSEETRNALLDALESNGTKFYNKSAVFNGYVYPSN